MSNTLVSEAVRAVLIAFDELSNDLSSRPEGEKLRETVRNQLVHHLVEAAWDGEHDPMRLKEIALARLKSEQLAAAAE